MQFVVLLAFVVADLAGKGVHLVEVVVLDVVVEPVDEPFAAVESFLDVVSFAAVASFVVAEEQLVEQPGLAHATFLLAPD